MNDFQKIIENKYDGDISLKAKDVYSKLVLFIRGYIFDLHCNNKWVNGKIEYGDLIFFGDNSIIRVVPPYDGSEISMNFLKNIASITFSFNNYNIKQPKSYNEDSTLSIVLKFPENTLRLEASGENCEKLITAYSHFIKRIVVKK